MSILASSSTILSILKTTSAATRNSLSQVRFQLPDNIKTTLLNFKSGVNTRDYENLVCAIRDSEITNEDLKSLLIQAKNCTSLLSPDLRLFVQALVMVRWNHRGNDIAKYYQEFIYDLISAHPGYIKIVIDQLIKLFLCTEKCDWIGSSPSDYTVEKFQNVHIILQAILSTVPLSDDIFFKSIRHNFPYFNTATYKQVSFLYNILKIVQYQADLRVHILQIVIDKLLLLDVHSSREDILEFEENQEDLLYEMEIDGAEEADKTGMKHPVANTLDIMMDILFKFIRNECFIDGKLIKARCVELFNDIMVTFESVILPTHDCHHIQFIIFYMCSFDSSLVNIFLKSLWKSVILPNVSPVIRQAAIGYVSSFLARADYLPLGYLKNYLVKMSDWIHNYIAHHDSTSQFQYDYKQHCVFHSVCQALFYLIAFRHQDLVNSSVKVTFLQSLNLAKIVSCRLNPLKFCLPTIVDNFAAVTRAYQLAYCYTIIENNTRHSVPLVGRGGQFAVNTVLNMCFPFDSYVLLKTCIYITPLYKEYKSTVKQESKNIVERKPRLCSGTEDEDDFIRDEISSDKTENSF